MKLRTRVFLQLATLCFALAAYGFAADNAYLYIVHGIPGRDIADNLNPGFPIDVLINGECQPSGTDLRQHQWAAQFFRWNV